MNVPHCRIDEPASSGREARVAAAWSALAAVEDPEIPALCLVDLGIVRFVKTQTRRDARGRPFAHLHRLPGDRGHPAGLVESALVEAGVGPVRGHSVLSPAWSSDWITPEGRRKLAAYGIVPPTPSSSMRRVLRPARRLSALPFRRHRMHQSIWLDALQGACTAAASAWSRSNASNAFDGVRVLSFHPLKVTRGRAHCRGCACA